MCDENKKTILLVEDEVLIAMGKKRALEKYGYTMITAHSGEEAISIFNKKNSINLILMDIDLGKGINGPDAAIKILKKSDVPVVFLSSHAEAEIVEKTEKITSYGYVVKSSDVTVLNASIKVALKLFKARKKAAINAEHFRAIVENTDDYIMRYNRKGQHTYGNPAALAVSGLSLEEYIGKSHRDLGYSERLCLLWEDAIESVFKTGKSKLVEFEFNMVKGQAILQLQLSPEFDSNKKVHSVIGVSRDITVLKQLEENLRTHQLELEMQNEELRIKQKEMEILRLQYFNLYDLAPVAYLTLNNKGLILEANLAATESLGIVRNELIGKNFTSFLQTKDQDIFYLYRNKLLKTGINQHCKLKIKRQDGSLFDAHLAAVMVQDKNSEPVCRLTVIECK